MNEREKDVIRLQHILEAINAIDDFISHKQFQDFKDDQLLQSAVIRQFEIIGEASRNISPNLKEQNADIPREQIAGLRNLLIHEYFRVDVQTIWESYRRDLPAFKSKVESLLNQLKQHD